MRDYYSPLSLLKFIWCKRDLIQQFAKRDIIKRYRGSFFGILWSFITPIIMLIIYTFVFSVVFKTKWGIEQGSKLDFAVILFCGMTAFNLFSEIITRSPSIITENVNYVKKVVFPLEIMPIVVLCSALFTLMINVFIIILSLLAIYGTLSWTVILLPIVILPIVFISLGLSWFFSSLGVYFRDLGQLINVSIAALMFLSPIFYPVSNVPKDFLVLYHINPISFVVEDLRNVMIMGKQPDWNWLFIGSIIGLIILYLGYIWFMKTRKGFADVL